MVEERAGFEKLDVRKEAGILGKMVINVCKKFPVEEKFRLTDQVKRSSRSITSNIAEGYGRFHYVDNIKFCHTARGSLNETLDHVITALDESYITEQELNLYRQQYTKVHRLLNGYISYLKSLN